MKRILTFVMTLLLILSLLTACGGDGSSSGNNTSSGGGSNTSAPPASTPASDSGNNTSSPAKQDARVIKASELIALEDAEHILGVEAKAHDTNFDLVNPLNPGTIKATYVSIENSLHYITIVLYQDALLDPNRAVDRGILDRGGTANYNSIIRPNRESMEAAVIIDGIGDWACITGYDKLRSTNVHTLEIGYGDYCIAITIIGWPKGNMFNDAEKIAWKTEKFTEAGNLALERLKAIIE